MSVVGFNTKKFCIFFLVFISRNFRVFRARKLGIRFTSPHGTQYRADIASRQTLSLE